MLDMIKESPKNKLNCLQQLNTWFERFEGISFILYVPGSLSGMIRSTYIGTWSETEQLRHASVLVLSAPVIGSSAQAKHSRHLICYNTRGRVDQLQHDFVWSPWRVWFWSLDHGRSYQYDHPVVHLYSLSHRFQDTYSERVNYKQKRWKHVSVIPAFMQASIIIQQTGFPSV